MPGYARDPSALTIASGISVNPAGNIQTNNVQSALYELDNEKLSTTSASSTYAVKTVLKCIQSMGKLLLTLS